MDTEKLIEELGRMMSMNYLSASRVRDEAVNAINGLTSRLAAAEKVVEAVRGLSFGEDWNNGTHAKIYRPQIRAALSAYDAAAKEAADAK